MEDADPFEDHLSVAGKQPTDTLRRVWQCTQRSDTRSQHQRVCHEHAVPDRCHACGTSPCKRRRSARATLALLEPHEWDQDNAYYSIEWKVVVNRRLTSKDTEPDVVVTPGAYWEDCLKSRAELLLEQIMGWNHTARVEGINVVVSVNARSERDLTKRFEREIDWRMVEKRLIQWGDLFQDGKKLRVDITFIYAERSQQSSSSSSKRSGARASATQQMLPCSRHRSECRERELW